MDKQDSQLIEDFLSGDENAFEALVSRHLGPLFGFLFRLTKDADVSEDLVQEAFLKAWKNIEKFERRKNFKAWLFTIGKNSAYDYFKKKKTVPFSFLEDKNDEGWVENISGGDFLPDELVHRKDLAVEMERKLESIQPRYRLILEMRYKEDFELLEIADILNLPYNTVKSHHQRALTALRKLF